MTPPTPKTCQRCHRPTQMPVTIQGNPQPHEPMRRLAEVCPLCYVQLLAFLNENLVVVKANDLSR
mgnify:FL=1